MLISLCLVLSKYAKIQLQEILFKSLNALEFFCMPRYTEFLSNLYEKFQETSVYDTNVEYQNWCFCCYLFLSYADDTHTYIYTEQTLKMWFSELGVLIMCKISTSKICLKKNIFSTIIWVRESKKNHYMIFNSS